MANLRWNGAQFLVLLKAEMRKRITVCALAVQNHAKKLIGLEGAASAIKPLSYWYGGRKRNVRKKGLVYGATVSRPGEPPRKQFGRLQSSVAHEVQDTVTQGPAGRVGTNLPYGRYLELGAKATRHSAWGRPTRPYAWTLLARPWLRRSLKEMEAFIKVVMARPWTP
jgi:hypothetical protein